MLNRTRTSTLDAFGLRDQRNRIYPALTGSDGSTLSLDFTAMSGLDSRFTFSRSSPATFINSSGLVQYADHNLFFNTAFSGLSGTNPSLSTGAAGWNYSFSTGSATFNGDGSVTMTASNQRIGLNRFTGFAGAGRRVILSVDILTSGDLGLTPFQIIRPGTATNEQYYINGVADAGSNNVVGPCTLSLAYDSATAGTTTPFFGVGANTNATGTVKFANPRFGLWNGTASFPYLANTSTSVERHDARFDYDPSTLAPRGLLIEGSATNLMYPSANGFNCYNTQKVGGAGNEPAVAATGIDGQQSAVTFTITQSGGTAPFLDARAGTGAVNSTYTVSASTTYTFSYYWKSSQTMVTRVFDGATNTLITATYADTPGPNGFTRRTAVFTTPSTTTSVWCAWIYGNSSNGAVYTVTGCQLEAGSGASSYIPTGASTVQRAADSCDMTGTNFSSWFNAGSAYSMLFRYSLNNPSAFAGVNIDRAAGTLSVSGVSNRTFIHAAYRTTSGSGDEGRFVRIGDFGSGTLDLIPATFPAAASNTRLAFAVDTNNAGLSAANQSLGTDSACTILTGQNQLELGRVGASNFINGCISLVKYWPTRLPNATLQALTA